MYPTSRLETIALSFSAFKAISFVYKKMRIMLKVTPTVKTKSLNVITVKLDTHGTFAGVCSA